MKKICLLVLTTLFVFSIQAQKMKVKKGQIQFDGVTVAKITQDKESNKGTAIRNTVIIRDLNDSILFKVSEHLLTPSGLVLPGYMMVLTGTNGNTREFSTKGIKSAFTMSVDLYMAQYIVNSGIDLITSKGINLENINEYFKSSDHSVSDAYDSLVKKAKDKYVKEDELAASVGLTIDKSGNIFAKGERIGKVSYTRPQTSTSPSTPGNTNHVYQITDINNLYIGSISSFHISTAQFYDIKTYDGKVFTIFSDKSSIFIHTDEIAKRFARKLYYENYIIDMLEKAGYIQNKKGYIIDGDEKKEGLITLEFLPKDAALRKPDIQFTASNYGNKAFLKSEDPNDNDTYKYDVKNKNGVIIVTDNAKYYSIDGYFHKVLYEKDGNMVLWEYVHDIPKIKLNGKGATNLIYTSMGFNKKTEVFKKDFNEYMNCPTLIYSDYNINGTPSQDIDVFIKLVDDYVEKCK